MDFVLFGQIRAEHDGLAVDLGRRQERCLLGLLLIETGRVISADRLADLLWDGAPPPAARRVIQTYIARLRRRLSPCGVQVATESGGYRADVPACDIDLHRFRKAVTQAPRIDDPARRAEALAAALELWQGPVLGELASEQLRNRVGAAFDELRLAAIEDCARAHLDSGQPDRALVALAAGPDGLAREQLIGLRMTALAAAGRKSEALAAYQSARAAMVRDIGLEPGPDLRRLHERILRGDGPVLPASRPVAAQGPAPPADGPRELPPAVRVFTGRREQRSRIAAVLRSADARPGRAPAVVIYGGGGIGKSALAIQVAHEVATQFPDGQIYIDLCGSTPGMRPRTATAALRHSLRSLGVPAADIPLHQAEAAAQLRSLTAGRRVLFVLDNATDAATVRQLLPGSGGCAVIITGRARLATVEAEMQLELAGLRPADARKLVLAIAGRPGEPADVLDRIVDCCERMPLALCIAAARLASRSGLTAERLAERLADQRSRLDELDIEGLAVRTSIQVSLDALTSSPEASDQLAAWLLPRLVAVPVPTMTAELAADMAGRVDVEAVRAAIGRLVDLHLMYRIGSQRYGLHDLIRLYAIELQARELSASEHSRAVGRAFDHYVAIAARVCEVLMPGRKPSGLQADPPAGAQEMDLDTAELANAWLDAEVPNVIAAAEFALSLPGERAMFPFYAARALHWLLGKRASWLAEFALTRLADEATSRQGSTAVRIDALTMHSQAEMHLGLLAGAEKRLQVAAQLSDQIGDRRRLSSVLTDQACVAIKAGDHELATRLLERALGLARAEGWTQREAILLLNLSSVHVDRQEWDEAYRALDTSLGIRRVIGDIAGLAIVLPAMGYLCLELDREAEALCHLSEAVDVCRRVGNEVDGWYAMFTRSVLHLTAGAIRPALRDAAGAARLCSESRPHETAATLRLLAIVTGAAGRTARSAEFGRQADLAYAAFSGRRDASIEAMLERAGAALARWRTGLA